MNDPILRFLIVDAVALLLLGAGTSLLPQAICGLLTATLCGLSALLCLPPLFSHAPAAPLSVPVGPPGLSLHFALDPLSLFFLLNLFVAGTAVAAFQSTVVQPARIHPTAWCVAGTALSLLAADGVAMVIGLAVTCASAGYRGRRLPMLAPALLLGAVCLLTPSGYAPRFDAIRAAPIDSDHATAAMVLTVAAVGALVWPDNSERCWTRDALTAGVLIPFSSYLLLRLIADLSAAAAQPWWGALLLLAGGAGSVVAAWRAAALPDIDTAIAALLARQAGLAVIGVGLAMTARTADLPAAAAFALDATCLTALGTSLAGTLLSLSAHTIGTSAGTYRLSRLGGLVHAMPGTSAALSAGLLTASALPPGLGFAALWLSFQSILSAPHTGGVLSQLPLALIAAAIALSAGLSTAASLRVVGIAVLGRPRTPRGAGAGESPSTIRAILLLLAATALLAGVLPGPLLRLLADPSIDALTSLPPAQGFGLLSLAGASPGYLIVPLLALLTLAVGAAWAVPRQLRKPAKPAGPWTDGMQPPIGLPFGDPAAQSSGAGFLPALPEIALPRPPPLPSLPRTRISATFPGLWLLLAGFAALLLALAVVG